MAKRNSLATTLSSVVCVMVAVLGLSLITNSPAVADNRLGGTYEAGNHEPGASPALDMQDDQYNSDFIFGMTRSVANSTLIGAVKPVLFLVTVPLDIVFLPFAAIGGLF